MTKCFVCYKELIAHTSLEAVSFDRVRVSVCSVKCRRKAKYVLYGA